MTGSGSDITKPKKNPFYDSDNTAALAEILSENVSELQNHDILKPMVAILSQHTENDDEDDDDSQSDSEANLDDLPPQVIRNMERFQQRKRSCSFDSLEALADAEFLKSLKRAASTEFKEKSISSSSREETADENGNYPSTFCFVSRIKELSCDAI